MKTTYTPGPWACGPDSAMLEPPRATFEVAFTRAAVGDRTMTERREAYEANARLISAAPELVEACRTLLWAIENGRQIKPDDLEIDAVRRAVKLAIG